MSVAEPATQRLNVIRNEALVNANGWGMVARKAE